MKIASLIASILLGLLFIFSSAVVLFNMVPEQPAPPEGSAVAMFMGAFIPTGYMTFVKVLEMLGGLLLLVPKTRNFGLLILGPIVVNILAFHHFVAKDGIFQPMLIGVAVLSLFLLWAERKAFLSLLR